MIKMKKSLILGVVGVIIILFAVAAILELSNEQADVGEAEGDSVEEGAACSIDTEPAEAETCEETPESTGT
jgi:hypothetical protein